MEKKISLLGALLALVFLFGCAELVFVRDAQLYRVKDDGDELQQIIPLPPPGSGNMYHRPDVNHNGDKVAFIAGTAVSPFGTLWRVNLDGGDARQINLDGSSTQVARWYPDDDRYIVYFGKDTGTNEYAIRRAQTNLAARNWDKICDTNDRDNLGFDINKPQTSPHQIIFARREANNKPKLYRRRLELAAGLCPGGPPVRIPPFPLGGVNPDDIQETFPVVSFSQAMLASAVSWPAFIGIRIRGIDQDGSIGLPVTFELQGLSEITGVSFADEDQKIYLSAQTSGGNNLYSIGFKEIIRALSDLLNPDPGEFLEIKTVDPKPIDVGPGNKFWPSGINTSTP